MSIHLQLYKENFSEVAVINDSWHEISLPDTFQNEDWKITIQGVPDPRATYYEDDPIDIEFTFHELYELACEKANKKYGDS